MCLYVLVVVASISKYFQASEARCDEQNKLHPPFHLAFFESSMCYTLPDITMPFCCVRECGNHTQKRKDSKLSFHTFPNKEKFPDLYVAWCNQINRQNFVPNKETVVCSEHFAREDLDPTSILKSKLLGKEYKHKVRIFLNKYAKPSLKLGSHTEMYGDDCSEIKLEKADSNSDSGFTTCLKQQGSIVTNSEVPEMEFVAIKQEPNCEDDDSMYNASEYVTEEPVNQYTEVSLKNEIDTVNYNVMNYIDVQASEDDTIDHNECDIKEVTVDHNTEVFHEKYSMKNEIEITNYNLINDIDVEDDAAIDKPTVAVTYECAICDKSYRIKSNLESHLKIHTGTAKMHKCLNCDMEFSTASYLKSHMETHTGSEQHKCGLCSRHFTRFSNLKQHMLTHSNIQPHKCTFCNKSFRLYCTLKYHVTSYHGPSQPSISRKHKCTLCTKVFYYARNLEEHMISHSDVKQYNCKYCDKKYKRPSGLDYHMATHSDILPFKCCVKRCYKQFKDVDEFNKHSLIHNGLK